MKKVLAKLIALVGFAVLGMLLSCASAAASDAIGYEFQVTPKALTGPGSVNVSINIVNNSDSASPISVTLHDPDGKVCSSFGSGGTANLQPNASSSYSGSWSVTQAQLEAGRIVYSARFTGTDENGNSVPASLPISASISHNTATAKLHIERVVDPGPKVVAGQVVTIRYIIKNTGTLDVSDITFKDPGIISEPAVEASLKAGDETELSYQFTAGSEAKTTHAELTYKYDEGGKQVTSKSIMADPPITIEVTVPDLIIELTTEKRIVNSGDKIDLKYSIENKGDLKYENLKLVDSIQGDVDSGFTLEEGQTREGTISVTVSKNQTHQLELTGADSTGRDIVFKSNELTVQTADSASTDAEDVDVTIDIVVEGNRDIIYEEPATMIFTFKVTNDGETDVENVSIATATLHGREPVVVRVIDEIPAGETYTFSKEFVGSMQGNYQFTATAKNADGADMVAESNQFPVVYEYIAPLPTFTATPVPTPDPTEISEDPNATEAPATPFGTPDGEGPGLGTILLYVMAGLFGVIIMAVGVLFFLGNRGKGGGIRGRSSAKVIDSIERVPHRDYAKAPKQEKPAKAPKAKRGKAVEPIDALSIDPISDYLIDEDIEDLGAPFDAPSAGLAPAATTVAAPRRSILQDDDDLYDDASAALDDTARMYQRPQSAVSVLPADAPRETIVKPTDAVTVSAPREAEPVSDETMVFKPASLAESSLGRKRETPAAPERSRRSTPEDEEAALRSGSTGQYRLSKPSASVWNRGGGASSAGQRAEDPDSYARKQRASRNRPASAPPADFYEDEPDDEPRTARRRRRE